MLDVFAQQAVLHAALTDFSTFLVRVFCILFQKAFAFRASPNLAAISLLIAPAAVHMTS